MHRMNNAFNTPIYNIKLYKNSYTKERGKLSIVQLAVCGDPGYTPGPNWFQYRTGMKRTGP